MTKKKNDELDFDVFDDQNLSLVEERLKWQKHHSKPWYLKPQHKIKKYPKDSKESNY